jgi:hypothetical protein
MSGWFGKSWGAAVCEPLDRHATPVGIKCQSCGIPIEPGDDGLTLMGVDGTGSLRSVVLHLECFAASLMPCPGCPHCQPERRERADRETDTGLN